jgi:hypothetical protein
MALFKLRYHSLLTIIRICACFSAKVRSIYAQPPLNAMLLRSQKTGEKTGGALMPLLTFICTGIDLPKTDV